MVIVLQFLVILLGFALCILRQYFMIFQGQIVKCTLFLIAYCPFYNNVLSHIMSKMSFALNSIFSVININIDKSIGGVFPPGPLFARTGCDH